MFSAPMKIHCQFLNHDPICPNRTRPDTSYQQNNLFIMRKDSYSLKKFPECSGRGHITVMEKPLETSLGKAPIGPG